MENKKCTPRCEPCGRTFESHGHLTRRRQGTANLKVVCKQFNQSFIFLGCWYSVLFPSFYFLPKRTYIKTKQKKGGKKWMLINLGEIVELQLINFASQISMFGNKKSILFSPIAKSITLSHCQTPIEKALQNTLAPATVGLSPSDDMLKHVRDVTSQNRCMRIFAMCFSGICC